MSDTKLCCTYTFAGPVLCAEAWKIGTHSTDKAQAKKALRVPVKLKVLILPVVMFT
jgi:hypothetical protein